MRILSVLTDQPVIDKILAHIDRKRAALSPKAQERAPPEEPIDRSSLSS